MSRHPGVHQKFLGVFYVDVTTTTNPDVLGFDKDVTTGQKSLTMDLYLCSGSIHLGQYVLFIVHIDPLKCPKIH